MEPASSLAHAARARRPRSLVEVAAWGTEPDETDHFLREFLDEFYVETDTLRREEMVALEPCLRDERTNAYLAAVAEHLAWRYGFPVPAWTGSNHRFLKTPFFPCGLESLKATLLVESPTAFRRRMIFVGADPLSRPRRERKGFGA